jgi:hypothetical protein
MKSTLRPRNLIAAVAVSAGFLGAQAAIASAASPATTSCDPTYCYTLSVGGWGVSTTVTPITTTIGPISLTAPLSVGATYFCSLTFCYRLS